MNKKIIVALVALFGAPAFAAPALPGLASFGALATPNRGALSLPSAPSFAAFSRFGALPARGAFSVSSAPSFAAVGGSRAAALPGLASFGAPSLPSGAALPAVASTLTITTPGYGAASAPTTRSGSLPIYGDYTSTIRNGGQGSVATYTFSRQSPAAKAEGLTAQAPAPRGGDASTLPPLAIEYGRVGPQIGPSLLPTIPNYSLGQLGVLSAALVNGGPGEHLTIGATYVSTTR